MILFQRQEFKKKVPLVVGVKPCVRIALSPARGSSQGFAARDLSGATACVPTSPGGPAQWGWVRGGPPCQQLARSWAGAQGCFSH